jgi:hypothetical protein
MVEPAQEELTGSILLEEVTEHQFSKEPTELESATEWPVIVTRDESSVGGQDDLPIEQHEELQLIRLHMENQSMK